MTMPFLLASNGHVVKTPWAYDNIYVRGNRMGCFLKDRFGADYFVIVTDAAENYFFASAGTPGATQKIFHLKRDSVSDFSAGESVLYISDRDLLVRGYDTWDLTMIGAAFSDRYAGIERQYAVPVSVPSSFNAMLFSARMTAIHK